MKPIEIFYSSECGLCTKALEFFRSRGATFIAYAVEFDAWNNVFLDSENTQKMNFRCKEIVDFVPQIFIGDKHIKGWRQLEQLINSGEINTWVPLAKTPD